MCRLHFIVATSVVNHQKLKLWESTSDWLDAMRVNAIPDMIHFTMQLNQPLSNYENRTIDVRRSNEQTAGI